MAGLAEQELDQAGWVIWAKRAGMALVLLLIVYGLVQLVRTLIKPTTGQQRQVARIAIVPIQPPPPPPPPKEEKKPEPKEERAQQASVEPPKQEQPAPTEQLKMEGEGSENGLAGIVGGTVRNENAHGAAGGSRFAWYGGLVQQQVQQALTKNPKLRGKEYRVVVRVWSSPDGAISRTELVGGTGNAETDELIRAVLMELPPLSERPPEGMPQPVKLRVTSRL